MIGKLENLSAENEAEMIFIEFSNMKCHKNRNFIPTRHQFPLLKKTAFMFFFKKTKEKLFIIQWTNNEKLHYQNKFSPLKRKVHKTRKTFHFPNKHTRMSKKTFLLNKILILLIVLPVFWTENASFSFYNSQFSHKK